MAVIYNKPAYTSFPFLSFSNFHLEHQQLWDLIEVLVMEAQQHFVNVRQVKQIKYVHKRSLLLCGHYTSIKPLIIYMYEWEL